MNDNARTELDQEEYRREYDTLSTEYKRAADRIGEIDEELRSREARKKQIAVFLRMFEKQEADVEFDPGMFVAMVERVVVQQLKSGVIELEFFLWIGEKYGLEISKS